MQKNISTIVIDFGGVISYCQSEKKIKKICKILGIAPDKYAAVSRKPRFDYDAGIIDARKYWDLINDSCNKIDLSDNDYMRLINYDISGWTKINRRTIRVIKKLKQSKYKLGILSNITHENLNHFIKKSKWLDYFDVKVFSCKEKVLKPHEEIYRIALKRLSESPENVLFIDDTEENVKAAERLGMHGMHYKSYDEMIKEMEERFGILI